MSELEDVKPNLCKQCCQAFRDATELRLHIADAHSADSIDEAAKPVVKEMGKIHKGESLQVIGEIRKNCDGNVNGVASNISSETVKSERRESFVKTNFSEEEGKSAEMDASEVTNVNHAGVGEIGPTQRGASHDLPRKKTRFTSNVLRTRMPSLKDVLLGKNEDFGDSDTISQVAGKKNSKSALIQCDLCDLMFKTVAAVNQHVSLIHPSRRESDDVQDVHVKLEDVEQPVVVAGSCFMNVFAWGQQNPNLLLANADIVDKKDTAVLGLVQPKREVESAGETSDHDVVPDLDWTLETKREREESEVVRDSAVLECYVCKLVFSDPEQLTDHKQTAHGNKKQKPIKCRKCGETFDKPDELKKHRKSKHQRQSGSKKKRDNETRAKEKVSETTTYSAADKDDGSETETYRYSPTEYNEGDDEVPKTKRKRKPRRSHPDGEKQFTCNVCEKIFGTRNHHKQHMMIHTGERPHVCAQCGKGFIKRADLFRHETVHSEVKPYLCNQCAKGFGTSLQLKFHMMSVHTGEKPFQCTVCGRGFIAQKLLRAHELKHSGIKKFLCNLCGMGLSSKRRLKAHIMLHNNDKPFKCKLCWKSYTTKHHLNKHEEVHIGGPHICERCGFEFRTRGYLSKHQRCCDGNGTVKKYTKSSDSDGEPRLKARYHTVTCEVCQKMLLKHNLSQHMITHTGYKPYKCDRCDKAFKRNYLLEEHMRSHTGERPFACDVCAKTFARRLGLKVHLRNHGKSLPALKRGRPTNSNAHVESVARDENSDAMTRAHLQSENNDEERKFAATMDVSQQPQPSLTGYLSGVMSVPTDLSFTAQLQQH